MQIWGHSRIVYVIWATLTVAIVIALATGRWSIAFVAMATLFLSALPLFFAERFRIKLPMVFFAWIVIFAFSTLFLGETFDFYRRYWWWDIALHGGSAVSFGLIGFIFVFMLFEGDRYAAPPVAIAFVAFCLAVTIGTGWEIFEFAMDRAFGLNMQKTGLPDTMGDLIVNAVGASTGALAGYYYLTGDNHGWLARVIDEFVRKNRRLFAKLGKKPRGGS